jgi:hypothetical protein
MAQGWTADLTTIVRHNRKAQGAGQEEGLEPLGGCGSRAAYAEGGVGIGGHMKGEQRGRRPLRLHEGAVEERREWGSRPP